MIYGSEDGSIMETLWNSRDGVTPFCIPARDGSTVLCHVNWRQDRRAPDHRPQPGDRVFVDLTPEMARLWAERAVAREWADPNRGMTDRYATKDAAVADLAASYFRVGATMVLVWPSQE